MQCNHNRPVMIQSQQTSANRTVPLQSVTLPLSIDPTHNTEADRLLSLLRRMYRLSLKPWIIVDKLENGSLSPQGLSGWNLLGKLCKPTELEGEGARAQLDPGVYLDRKDRVATEYAHTRHAPHTPHTPNCKTHLHVQLLHYFRCCVHAPKQRQSRMMYRVWPDLFNLWIHARSIWFVISPHTRWTDGVCQRQILVKGASRDGLKNGRLMTGWTASQSTKASNGQCYLVSL